jgi:phosphoglycolate phosphatase-like HAD superfamily hydrolase
MSAIDNLLFDLDGTLTDPEAGIIGCFRFARDSLGDDDVMPDPGIVIGPPLRDSFRDLLTDPGDDRVEAAVRLYQKQFSESGMYDNVAYPEIPQTLTALGEHSRLFVVTSKPRISRSRFSITSACLQTLRLSTAAARTDATRTRRDSSPTRSPTNHYTRAEPS